MANQGKKSQQEEKNIRRKKEAGTSATTFKSPLLKKEGDLIRHPMAFLGGILLLTIILYFGSLKGDILHMDDDGYITLNTAIHHLDGQHIKDIFTSFYAANYHPLTTLSWAVEYSLVGEKSAFLYHFDNLFLHLVNVVLVFFLFKLISRRNSVALLVALLHAIHPMHVESVAWISERKDLLYSCFFLLSLSMYYLYLRHSSQIEVAGDKPFKANNKKTTLFFLSSLIFFLLSLLSKSAAVILPLTLFLFDYLFRRKLTPRLFLEKIPFFALSVLFGILALKSQAIAVHYNLSHQYDFFQKILILNHTVIRYLLMCFFPVGLSAFHPWPELTGSSLPSAYYISPFITVLVVIGVIFSIRRSRLFVFGVLFFLTGLILILQLIPVGGAVMAERYTYLPYLGLFYPFAVIIMDAIEEKNKKASFIKPALTLLLLIAVVDFSYASYNRTKVFLNDKNLWDDMIQNYPETAYDAYLYRAKFRMEKNDVKGAYEDLSKLIQWKKYDVEALTIRGQIKADSGNYTGALNDFDRAIELDPSFYLSFSNRGAAKMKMNDLNGAVEDFNQSIKNKSDYEKAWFNRGAVKISLKDFKGAIEDFNNAINLKPEYCEAYFGKAVALADSGSRMESVNVYSDAITCNPNYHDAYHNRGYVKMQMNDHSGALNDFSKAIELNPQFSLAYLNRGNVKMLLNDFTSAISDIQKSLELNPANGEAYNKLGTLRFKTGDKPGALKEWQKGAQLGNEGSMANLRSFSK